MQCRSATTCLLPSPDPLAQIVRRWIWASGAHLKKSERLRPASLNWLDSFSYLAIIRRPESIRGRLTQMQYRNGALLLPSPYTLARHFLFRRSCSKLFVGGLCYDTNETVLRDAFRHHGEVVEARVICDRVTGKSKGYGFVKFNSDTAASAAMKEMNSQLLDGRNIRIQFAHKG